MSGAQRLGVVVVGYGSAALIEENLGTVAASLSRSQDPGLNRAILVVVDNFSGSAEREATESVVGRLAERWTDSGLTFELVTPAGNLGFGAGNDEGVAAARRLGADVFCLLNPDAVIEADDLARLVDAVRAEPMLLAGPVILRPDGSIWSDGHDLDLATGVSSATRKRPDGVTPGQRLEWLTGAVLVLGEQLWDAVGGLGNDYFLYWEDVDLSRRVQECGGRIQVVRSAHALHDEGGTHRDDQRGHSPLFTYYNVRNRMVFASRHLNAAASRRWAATAPAYAKTVLDWSGRRAVLRRPELVRAAVRGTLDGLWLARVARGHEAWQPQRSAPTVRLLTSFPDPRPTTNPYIVMLKESLEARTDVDVETFSWRRALTGRHDVFHAHWPEILVNGASPLKKLVRQVLFAVMLVRFRAQGTAIVRTVHNLDLPQGISPIECVLLRLFDSLTDLRIRINDSTQVPGPVVTVLHGHYVDWFAHRGDPQTPPRPGGLAYVGLIRRYKAVDTLMRAFTSTDEDDLSLVVAGKPSSERLGAEMAALANADSRIDLRLGFLSEEELADTVRGATVIVQPAPEMHNSGTVLAALSLGRPVLVPDNGVNRRLAEEVGSAWVSLFSDTISGDDLTRVLPVAAAAVAGGGHPDLSARDWSSGAAAHVEAYRQAMAVKRGAQRSLLSHVFSVLRNRKD